MLRRDVKAKGHGVSPLAEGEANYQSTTVRHMKYYGVVCSCSFFVRNVLFLRREPLYFLHLFFFSSCFASKHTCQTYHKFVDEDVDVTLMNILSCLLPRLLLLCCHARFRFGATAPLSTPGATATPSRLRTAPLLLLLPRLLLHLLLPRRQNLKEPQLPSLTQAAAAAAAVHHLGCAPRARCFMKPP